MIAAYVYNAFTEPDTECAPMPLPSSFVSTAALDTTPAEGNEQTNMDDSHTAIGSEKAPRRRRRGD